MARLGQRPWLIHLRDAPTKVIPSVVLSPGFDVLYGLINARHGGSGSAAGALVGAVFLAAFLLPTRLFHQGNRDVVPEVLSQPGKRWIVATAWLAPRDSAMQPGMALHKYSAVAILVFHGLAGLHAKQIVYLQVTGQYNSNRLLAVTMLLTVFWCC